MEAVPATSGARRTVRLAAALVVGQVFLVAIVGWVTLTRTGEHQAPRAAGVDQLAAPPAMIPPAPPGSSPGPVASRASSVPARKRAQTADSGTAAPKRSAASPARAFGPAQPPSPAASSSAPLALFPPPTGPSTPVPSTAATTPPAGPAATPSPTGPASPEPVLAGLPCDRMGAVTRADDGRIVSCLPTRNGELRWKIV